MFIILLLLIIICIISPKARQFIGIIILAMLLILYNMCQTFMREPSVKSNEKIQEEKDKKINEKPDFNYSSNPIELSFDTIKVKKQIVNIIVWLAKNTAKARIAKEDFIKVCEQINSGEKNNTEGYLMAENAREIFREASSNLNNCVVPKDIPKNIRIKIVYAVLQFGGYYENAIKAFTSAMKALNENEKGENLNEFNSLMNSANENYQNALINIANTRIFNSDKELASMLDTK